MDYESIHGKGESNFSSPLSHRMPTVSATQALQDQKTSPKRYITTGLKDLDSVLQNQHELNLTDESSPGGISRGKITEIYGPPGVGKTAIGIQLAVNTLQNDNGVFWVDAGSPLCGTRLLQVLTGRSREDIGTSKDTDKQHDMLSNLTHLSVPSLSHLIAILTDPAGTVAAQGVGLLVIDSFSTLINNAFPRTTDTPNTPKKPGAQKQPSRRFPMLQYIINALQKLAATQNIAVVILSQCVTKMRPGAGAVLVPAVNTTFWEQGLGARVALYRDWGGDDENGRSVDNVRFVQVLKSDGVNVPEGRQQSIAFTIQENGLEALKMPLLSAFGTLRNTVTTHTTHNTDSLPHKRKLTTTSFEIPDSDAEDDEDYGWADEDEQELPAPPPQWQGSEDILITRIDQLEEDDGDEEDARDVESPDKRPAKIQRREIAEIDDSEDELA